MIPTHPSLTGVTETTHAAGAGRYPGFLIIGAMKAGTTTLYEHLRNHPQVFMSDPKEPNYFSMDDVYEGKGRDWYRGLFAQAGPGSLCGEASPSYTRFPRFPKTPRRIAEAIPDVKLVYIMRHPVERFYSNYAFDRSFGFTESLSNTLTERTYVMNTSRYIEQIKRYLDWFPREQLHCLLLDDLRTDPAGTLARLAEFLGIDGFNQGAPRRLQTNARGDQHTTRQGNRLLQTARNVPGAGIAKSLLSGPARAAVRDFVSQKLPNSPMGTWFKRRHLEAIEPFTDELRAELHYLLDPATIQLEEFLGRDLSFWRRDGAGGGA